MTDAPRSVRLVIPGEPFALKRARAVRMGEFIRMHDDKRNVSWKGAAQLLMQAAMAGQPPLVGPVGLEIVAYFACPRGDERKREPRPERWSQSQKDCDNIAKAVGDSGNGTLWFDDRQIAMLSIQKRIAAQGQPARLMIDARELGD